MCMVCLGAVAEAAEVEIDAGIFNYFILHMCFLNCYFLFR